MFERHLFSIYRKTWSSCIATRSIKEIGRFFYAPPQSQFFFNKFAKNCSTGSLFWTLSFFFLLLIYTNYFLYEFYQIENVSLSNGHLLMKQCLIWVIIIGIIIRCGVEIIVEFANYNFLSILASLFFWRIKDFRDSCFEED